MTASDLLPLAVLRRKAVVYIRQSTPSQVQMNLESQRRQLSSSSMSPGAGVSSTSR